MKRKALLIGYSGWDIRDEEPLKGVSFDLQGYKEFLMSISGGAWEHNEIEIVLDDELKNLEYILKNIRNEHNDIVFSVFTGHGDYDEHECCRRLEIAKDKIISERELLGLAPKQILICDCCSKVSKSIIETTHIVAESSIETDLYIRQIARKEYERICKICPNQIIRLYASAIGYYANDTENGGLYSHCLLDTLQDISKTTNIVTAHNIASQLVEKQTMINPNYEIQKTGKIVPRLHSEYLLPGAIII